MSAEQEQKPINLPNLGPAPELYPYPKREPPPAPPLPRCDLHPGAPLACRACAEVLIRQAHQAGAESQVPETELRAELAAAWGREQGLIKALLDQTRERLDEVPVPSSRPCPAREPATGHGCSCVLGLPPADLEDLACEAGVHICMECDPGLWFTPPHPRATHALDGTPLPPPGLSLPPGCTCLDPAPGPCQAALAEAERVAVQESYVEPGPPALAESTPPQPTPLELLEAYRVALSPEAGNAFSGVATETWCSMVAERLRGAESATRCGYCGALPGEHHTCPRDTSPEGLGFLLLNMMPGCSWASATEKERAEVVAGAAAVAARVREVEGTRATGRREILAEVANRLLGMRFYHGNANADRVPQALEDLAAQLQARADGRCWAGSHAPPFGSCSCETCRVLREEGAP